MIIQSVLNTTPKHNDEVIAREISEGQKLSKEEQVRRFEEIKAKHERGFDDDGVEENS